MTLKITISLYGNASVLQLCLMVFRADVDCAYVRMTVTSAPFSPFSSFSIKYGQLPFLVRSVSSQNVESLIERLQIREAPSWKCFPFPIVYIVH